jgi:undecaprenyl-diphosphatase
MKKYFTRAEKEDKNRWLSIGGFTTTLILSAITLFLLLIITSVFIFKNNVIDTIVFDALAPHISEKGIRAMTFISFFGKHTFLILVSCILILYFLIKKNKWMVIRTAFIMVSSPLLMTLIKRLMHRHRPPDPLIEGITNFSFPSGHSFMSVIFYGSVIWYASIQIKNKWIRNLITLFLLLLIVVVGFSRVYLRLHYTTDVIAGFCLAFIWLLLSLWFVDQKEKAAKFI